MMQRTESLSEESRLTAMGLRLRHAREALQISEASAAQQLYLSVEQVRALEEAHYEQLPAEVFVRGYLRSYARLLGLDPEDILRQYSPPRTPALSMVEGGRDGVATAAPAVTPAKPGGKKSITGALTARIEGVPWRERLRSLPAVGRLEHISDTALMALSGVAIVLVVGTVTALLFTGKDQPGSLAGADGSSADDLASQALVVDPDLFKVVDDATRVEVSLPSTGTALQDDSGTVQGEQTTESGGQGPAVDGQVLELEFKADCWVEVKDSLRNILLADMRRAGDREVIRGEPPYKVLLGRADAVSIRFRGEPYPVTADKGKDYTRVIIGG